jgi:transcriptional/translational regulatory protein YebC/TACO1
MAHTLTVSDEVYQHLLTLAQAQGKTPEGVIETLLSERGWREPGRDPNTNPRYYTTVEWFRHLGMTDEQIRRAAEEAEADSDADA